MALYRNALPHKIQDVFLSRAHVILTLATTLFCSFLYRLPNFPFDQRFCLVSFSSFIVHVLILIFYKHLTPLIFNIISFINLAMLGLAIHFTGGVLSPFTGVFILMIISGAYYGIKYRIMLISAFLIYIGVIFSEALGWLTPLQISPASLYKSWPILLVIVVTIVGLMAICDSIYKLTMVYLRNQLERELSINQSMKDKLNKLDAHSQIGLLVGKIAHDIRGPLGAVSGFIKMFHMENNLSPETKEDCDVILVEMDRITNLLNRMINYAKPGDSTKAPVCPVDLLETVLSVLSFYPGAKRIKFGKEFPLPGKIFIHANKDELQQVIFNLLKNCIEALEAVDNPHIDIKILTALSEVTIQIKDNGPGIPQDHLNKLGQSWLSTKKEGAGVGLIIVQEIVEVYGGKFSLESQPGDGTTATILLPAFSN